MGIGEQAANPMVTGIGEQTKKAAKGIGEQAAKPKAKKKAATKPKAKKKTPIKTVAKKKKR